jgi:hypothetical protein
MPEVLAGWENPSQRLVPASRPGRPASGSNRASKLLLPFPHPLGIHVEGANGPTNARAGGICPVEEWRGLNPQSSARSIDEKEGLRSPAWAILTIHPCSSSRPMARLVLAGTLSISELRRSDS